MINQEELKELLHYDPLTGVFIRLRKVANRDTIGEVVGHVSAKGYVIIKIHQKAYKAHRLAILYMTGEFPIALVDHLNGVKHDNAWFNLREATALQNNYNKTISAHNKTGYVGVCHHKDRYRADIRVGGKNVYLGLFATAEAASEAYETVAVQLHEGFHRKLGIDKC